MSIIRGPRPDAKFYTVSKDISEDRRLSWGARGLLIFLLGKPDHWKVSVKHLITQTEQCLGVSSGRDAVRGLLKELQTAGYVRAVQAHSDAGRFDGVDYIVSELAEPPTPQTDIPAPANPAPGYPAPANPHLVNTDKKAKKEEEANNQSPSKARARKLPAGHTELPADFAANETHAAYAADYGLNLDAQLGLFKDKALAEAWTAADWAAKFRTFLRKAVEFSAKPGRGYGQAPKNRATAYQSAANGKLLGDDGQPKDYLAGVNDDVDA